MEIVCLPSSTVWNWEGKSVLPDSCKDHWSVKYFTLPGVCFAGVATYIPTCSRSEPPNSHAPGDQQLWHAANSGTRVRRNHMLTKI